MTTPKSESINTVSEPQPLGYDHSLGGNLHFPLPAISATPLRISDSPIPESKAPLGKFTDADADQMHLYLNYAREHWTHEGENPPVGLILCAEKDESAPDTPSTTSAAKSSPANTKCSSPTKNSSPQNWKKPVTNSRLADDRQTQSKTAPHAPAAWPITSIPTPHTQPVPLLKPSPHHRPTTLHPSLC